VVAALQKERALLPELARWVSLPLPRFEFLPEAGQVGGPPFAGYRKIPGEPLTAGLAAAPGVAGQIGRFLSELHRFPVQKAVQLGLQATSPAQWRQDYVDFYEWIRGQVFPRLEAPWRAAAAGLWESFLDNEGNFRFQPALIHGDLYGEHILCDPVQQRVNGVIDWGDANIGDPSFDLVGLLGTGGRGFVEGVLNHYSGVLGENLWPRINFYLTIIPFHQIRFGLEENLATHREQGFEQLYRNLTEWKKMLC
jgi:aminoglycoside 2''-phosphotransferase